MGFLDNYEGNKERTDRWLATFKKGRIEVNIVEFNAEKGYILVQAKGWRDQTELEPADVDYAYGFLAAYNTNMKRWFVEDTCTSAILRVMQLVMGGAERTTRETMEQIEALPAAVAKTDLDYDYWTTKFGEVPSFKTQEQVDAAGTPDSLQQCKHGKRVFREGTAKTGKPWANYSCIEKRPEQCDPNWLVMSSDGKWKPQL